jgi:hypothetical protein
VGLLSGAKGIFNILFFHFKFFHSAEFAKMITNYENILHFQIRNRQVKLFSTKRRNGAVRFHRQGKFTEIVNSPTGTLFANSPTL